MGTVMIRCPRTGREISTGIEAERDRYRCAPVFFARTFCPFCRTPHEWFATQAWVREAPVAARRALAASPVRSSRESL
jgi:hypothetical protein